MSFQSAFWNRSWSTLSVLGEGDILHWNQMNCSQWAKPHQCILDAQKVCYIGNRVWDWVKNAYLKSTLKQTWCGWVFRVEVGDDDVDVNVSHFYPSNMDYATYYGWWIDASFKEMTFWATLKIITMGEKGHSSKIFWMFSSATSMKENTQHRHRQWKTGTTLLQTEANELHDWQKWTFQWGPQCAEQINPQLVSVNESENPLESQTAFCRCLYDVKEKRILSWFQNKGMR